MVRVQKSVVAVTRRQLDQTAGGTDLSGEILHLFNRHQCVFADSNECSRNPNLLRAHVMSIERFGERQPDS